MEITLGPPVCALPDRKEMLARFIAAARHPLFCYLPHDVLPDLQDSGLHCAGMGMDRYVDITALTAQPASEIRGALKKADKVNFHVSALDLADISESQLKRLQSISRAYLQRSQCTIEMSFINRPMCYRDDGLRRVYALNKYDGEHIGEYNGMFGYAVLNPYFHDGRVRGYLLDILRFEPTKLWGVWLSTVWHIARLLSREDCELSLGFCPLYGIHKSPVNSSAWLETQIRWMAKYLSKSQYVRRLHELKSLVPGPEYSRYFASHTRNLVPVFAALIKASGINLGYLFGPELFRAIAKGAKA